MSFSEDMGFLYFCGSAGAVSSVRHWNTARAHFTPGREEGRNCKVRALASASASASAKPLLANKRAAMTSPAGVTAICTTELESSAALGQERKAGGSPAKRAETSPSRLKTDWGGTILGGRKIGNGSVSGPAGSASMGGSAGRPCFSGTTVPRRSGRKGSQSGSSNWLVG